MPKLSLVFCIRHYQSRRYLSIDSQMRNRFGSCEKQHKESIFSGHNTSWVLQCNNFKNLFKDYKPTIAISPFLQFSKFNLWLY